MPPRFRLVALRAVVSGVLLNGRLEAADYCVAKNDSDQNLCTASAPCLTVTRGVSDEGTP
jgi:hypothetical protein